MTPPEKMGLVCAGGVTQSIIARLPSLRAQVGPIKGVSYAAARRSAVTLRAGFAVEKYEALQMCPAIFVNVPEPAVADVLHNLPPGRSAVIVCGTDRESSRFSSSHPLATLQSVGEPRQFCAEGHAAPMAILRKLFIQDRIPLLQLRTGAKSSFLAGVDMATELLRPWIAEAVQAMVGAGLDRFTAAALVESFAARTVRSQTRLTPKPFSAALEAELRATLQREGNSQMYAEGLRIALKYFEAPKKVKAAHA